LIPEAKETERLQDWEGWSGSHGIPVKFILNSGHDESYEEMVSFYNNREIELAVKCVQNLLSPDSWPFPKKKLNVPIAANEIAVMAPFREQVKRLRNALRSAGLRSVNVGPVEAYQGSEYRFVIICTTRARERFLKNDKEKGVGVILEPRRINVAMTRAKEGLAVIGNPWILEKDPTWREWMNFAWRHHAVEQDPEDQSAVRPLQSQRQKQENKGPKEAAAFAASSASPALKTYSSAASIGRTKPVNEWRPRGDDIEIAGCISRLETALVFKSKAREGAVFGLSAGEDDPLFLSGISEENVEVGEE
jgi:helicase MOV-10